ncbi:MAG: hypothetical protein JST33_11655 [Actinobacteria bacterium]|nr:hypothetical protein [Actinomycetota bacterium]
MTERLYGPLEFFVVAFEGDRPDPGVLSALRDATSSGTVRLLDLVIATPEENGGVRMLEITENALFGTEAPLTLEVQGLIGEEDVIEVLSPLEPGVSVAVVALELLWAADLAQRVALAGGTVVRSERIPAPVVNELVGAVTADGALLDAQDRS